MTDDLERTLPLAAMGIANLIEDSPERRDYDRRMGIRSEHFLTCVTPSDTDWIVSRLRDRIVGRVVVEIGAGAGILACELARHAARVYAIEADIAWSWAFARHLYQVKPDNLTWILDRAENVVDLVRGDVAVVATGSDVEGLRQLAARFAPEVIMPWQDWHEGLPSTQGGRRGPATPCRCLFGCVLAGAHGAPLHPGEACSIRLAGGRPR